MATECNKSGTDCQNAISALWNARNAIENKCNAIKGLNLQIMLLHKAISLLNELIASQINGIDKLNKTISDLVSALGWWTFANTFARYTELAAFGISVPILQPATTATAAQISSLNSQLSAARAALDAAQTYLDALKKDLDAKKTQLNNLMTSVTNEITAIQNLQNNYSTLVDTVKSKCGFLCQMAAFGAGFLSPPQCQALLSNITLPP
jgi:predicted  nucleic acid-binding Zn-ribbon protein